MTDLWNDRVVAELLLFFGNVLVHSTVLAALALVAARLLLTRATVRHCVLFSALFALMIMPVLTVAFAKTGIEVVSIPLASTSADDEPSVAVLQPVDVPMVLLAELAQEVVGTGDVIDETVIESEVTALPTRAPLPVPADRHGRDDSVVNRRAQMQFAASACAVIWLLGTLFGFCGIARSAWKLKRIIRRTRPFRQEDQGDVVEQVRRTLNIQSMPPVVCSSDVTGPTAAGALRPRIILPASIATNLSEDELRDILLHEMGHVLRRDHLIVLLQRIAAALYWLNPLIHLVNRQLARAREEICDNYVLSTVEPVDYAETLLHLGQLLPRPRLFAASASLFNTEWKIEDRIADLLDERRKAVIRLQPINAVAIIISALVLSIAIAGSHVGLVQARSAAGNANPVSAQLSERSTTDSLGDPLPQGARLRLGTLRFRHPSTVIELALAPDEKTIVTIGSSGLIVWDVATGKEQWRVNPRDYGVNLLGAAYGIRAVAFDSDSSRFYTPGRYNEAIAWEVSTGRHEVLSFADVLPIIPGNQPPAARLGSTKAVDVTSDGHKLAIGSSHGVVVCDQKGQVLFKVVNAPDGPFDIDEMNRDRLTFGGPYSFCKFSDDDKILAVVTSDSPEEVRLLDSTTGRDLRRIPLKSRLVRLAFSPDSKQIVTTERDSAVRLYAVESGEEIWSHEIEPANSAESYTSAIAYSPDAKIIAACTPIGSDYLIYLLDSMTGKEIGRLSGHTWKPWAVAFTADSKILYSSGWDGSVRRWDVSARQQLPLPKGVRGTGVCAASPDGQKLAYADDLGVIRLVDSQNGAQLRTLELPGTRHSQLTFSPDSQYLAAGGTNGGRVQVAIWDLRNGQVAHQWDWPRGRDPHATVESLCFTLDGNRLAAAVFRQSSAYLWDLTIDRQIAHLTHDHVYGLSFSPDGKTLATAGWDKIVRFWDAETGTMRREVDLAEELEDDGGDLRMYTVCFAPKGNLMATAHLSGKVRIWGASDMKLQTTFQVEGRFVFGSIRFSPNGLWLATGSMNGNVAVWDPLTSEKMWGSGQHQHYVYTVSFGHDNRSLLSGGSDGVCYLWDLRSRESQTGKDLNRLWNDLAGGDGQAAYHAMSVLAEMPAAAVTLLARNVRPGDISISRDRVRTWIVDLDSPDSATRDAAQTGLATAGSVAVEPVREALAIVTPPERTQYLKKLLAEAKATETTERRAASLLAKLGTRKARLLLKGWTSQDPNGALGRSAAAFRQSEED